MSQDNVEVVRRLYEAFNRRDVEAAAQLWAAESMVAEPVALREVGGDVLVHVQLRAVGRASGIAFEQPGWTVFRVLDGRVTAGRAYTSEADALEAVGQ